MAFYLAVGKAAWGFRCALRPSARQAAGSGTGAGWGLKAAAAGGLLFLNLPLAFILLYAFTTDDRSFTFPPPGLTLDGSRSPGRRADIWQALGLSVRGGAAAATAMALMLGTLAALAMYRFRFFGKESVTLLILLPIALPGIVTGISLRSAFALGGIPFSYWTIVLGHATFCIVVVYNNVIARLRRSSPALIEASMDLGANSFQTFRHVVLPNIATALLAGGMLAFALSLRRGDRHDLHRRPAGDPADLDAEASCCARATGR